MSGAISIELRFFLVSILWGAIILLVYDCLRILRRLIAHNSFFMALEDLIFWVLTSLFIFSMIYTMNNGTIRGFSVMGMGIGMVLYHYILSELIVKWITKLFILLLSPIRYINRKIQKIIHFFTMRIKKYVNYLRIQLKKYAKSVKISLDKKIQTRVAKRTKKNKQKSDKKLIKKKKKSDKPSVPKDNRDGQQHIVTGRKTGRQGSIPIRKS